MLLALLNLDTALSHRKARFLLIAMLCMKHLKMGRFIKLSDTQNSIKMAMAFMSNL